MFQALYFGLSSTSTPIQRSVRNPKWIQTSIPTGNLWETLDPVHCNSLCRSARALNQQSPSRYFTERLNSVSPNKVVQHVSKATPRMKCETSTMLYSDIVSCWEIDVVQEACIKKSSPRCKSYTSWLYYIQFITPLASRWRLLPDT